MITYIRTSSDNSDFIKLVSELDADLRIRDGEDHSFYAQFNKLDAIKYVIVAYEKRLPVGCGAIKEYSVDTMEVKRMYVSPDKRRMGIASGILKSLENWAIELNYAKCLLETGKRQPEAISLYTRNDYHVITNYGQYKDAEYSICFEKVLVK